MTITDTGNSGLCPECKGYIYHISERAENVCSQCGLVVDERIPTRNLERRVFTPKERKERKTTDVTNTDLPIELMTFINKKEGFCYVDKDKQRIIDRDKSLRWQHRKLLVCASELKRVCSNLYIPDYIKTNAFRFYKRATKYNIQRGRSIKAMSMACLWAVLKEENYNRILLKQIGIQSPRTLKEIRQAYSGLMQKCAEHDIPIIKHKKDVKENIKENSFLAKALALVPRYTSELGYDMETENKCKYVLKKYITKYFINGINPLGLVAGTLYIVGKMRGYVVTQKNVAKLCGCTEVTLRSRYKQLVEKLNLQVERSL